MLNRRFTLSIWSIVFGLLFVALSFHAEARPERPGLIPNGSVFNCANCHISAGGGGPRTPFGEDVLTFLSSSSTNFWSPDLAELDSDGDGFTNGEELGDPAGAWEQGDPSPGVSANVSNPGALSSIPPVQASAEGFVATLHSQNLTSPISSQGRGVAMFRLQPNGTDLDYILQVFDLDGVTAAHIHDGVAGQDGGVVYPLDAPMSGQSSGTITIDTADAERLANGSLYVNVHTSENPGGEIRGQITDEPYAFKSELSGAKQPTPIDSSGVGAASISISNDWSLISWTLTVTGLDNITASHFHEGGASESGGVLIAISQAFSTETSGEAALSEDHLKLILAEQAYINVHTSANPAGEIRGQVEYDAEFPVASAVDGWFIYR
ncbi:MAG: CHRD domain-containing protein [Candidatus Hinthialibacter antarcticus]|nr:CHRD domain-containing protein [Candidatus Hinthialibacter antarcticus]